MGMDTFDDLPPLDLDDLLALEAPPAGEPWRLPSVRARGEACAYTCAGAGSGPPVVAAPAPAAAPSAHPGHTASGPPKPFSAADSLASAIIAAGLRALLMSLPRQ